MSKVLIACEESQEVCKAFRRRGIDAWSCDIQPCSGGHPEWHLQCDVREVLDGSWSMVIAHPTCTRLTNSGVRWLEKRNLWNELDEACEFFNLFKDAADRVCIENPIPHKYARAKIGNYTQIIHPWMFGHPEKKATCLWLKNLPPLEPTNDVSERMNSLPKNQQQRIHYMPPGPERTKLRSKTFSGIAEAFAKQWGDILISDMMRGKYMAAEEIPMNY